MKQGGRQCRLVRSPRHALSRKLERSAVPSHLDPQLVGFLSFSLCSWPHLGVLVGLHVGLSDSADQGGIVRVLSIGLIIHLQGLLRLVGKVRKGVSFSPLAGEVILGAS